MTTENTPAVKITKTQRETLTTIHETGLAPSKVGSVTKNRLYDMGLIEFDPEGITARGFRGALVLTPVGRDALGL